MIKEYVYFYESIPNIYNFYYKSYQFFIFLFMVFNLKYYSIKNNFIFAFKKFFAIDFYSV